ncbi:MAG: hypothetical protein Q9167_003367 [Letrouitia subvulpina]
MAPTPLDIPTFAKTQLSLLNAELLAETSQTSLLLSTHAPRSLARAGLAVINLLLSNQRTGLGGKTVLELEPDHATGGEELGEHEIRVGDIVSVGAQPRGNEKTAEKKSIEGRSVQGVVVRAGLKTLQVALDRETDETEGLGRRLWV